MKIMNSVVVIGLYYGFLSTFSIGPSYLFLLRARIMQEGTEKKLSATAGFITGQLIMFISIYYAPLHLALGRPHIITVIPLPRGVIGSVRFGFGPKTNRTDLIGSSKRPTVRLAAV
ncbi:hypothetical protein Ahy_A02g006633 isoform B [Arachis hypogaea]|nr:hypothetical protein Ahy_A02g006633 isoform B [Arachis hypogaea]